MTLQNEQPNIVDLFCGGGGVGEGFRRATGSSPTHSLNHCPHAIYMHSLNHPDSNHSLMSIYVADPTTWVGSNPAALWASVDCTHFSKAKGGKPLSNKLRALASEVFDKWVRPLRPRVFFLENVDEFKTWGPLDDSGRPIKDRQGEYFQKWVRDFRELGYTIAWKSLVACDYGAPTTRKRLFVVARRDGAEIAWPEPTYGQGRPLPWRTAGECIDWSIHCPSIFTRKRPLAEATQRRIAHGLKRYVLETDKPFVVDRQGQYIPWMISTRNGERKGQTPRTRDVARPFPTVTSKGSQGALIAAWIAKNNGGVVGQALHEPAHTVTKRDSKGLVAAFLTKYYGSGKHNHQSLHDPLHTIRAKGNFSLVEITIQGQRYTITDIGYRMLQPRELARATGLDDTWQLCGTKTEQIARIGNMVPPAVVEALVRVNLPELCQ